MKVLSLIGTILDSVLRVIMWAAIIYMIYTGAIKCYDYGYRIFTEKPMSVAVGREVTVTVPVDFSSVELGKLFEENGLSRDHILFTLQYYCSEYRKDIEPGTYTFNTRMTAEEMFGLMAGVAWSTGEEESEAEDLEKAGKAQ